MVKFAIIGLGIGERHVAALRENERVHISCVCDLNIAKAESIASKYNVPKFCDNWKSILNDGEIDAVIIASYDHAHAEQVIAFLRKRVHIFVEKPLCTTMPELESIDFEYAKANVKAPVYLSTNFILRKEKRFVQLKEKITNGELGDIYSVEASYDYGRIHKILDGWRSVSPNYSVMNGGGVHMIDLCQWLTGEKFNPLFAIHNKLVTKNSTFLAPDFTSALGRLGSKIVFKVTANFGSQTPHYHQLKIYGTKGTYINDCANGTYYFGHEPGVETVHDKSPFPCANKGDLLPNFVSVITEGGTLDVGFDDVSSVMRTSLLIDQLAK